MNTFVIRLPQIDETPSAPQTNLLQEVEMKKQELVLLQALHQKKKELITLQLKAALTAQNQKLESVTATVVDSKKEELKVCANLYCIFLMTYYNFYFPYS